MRISRKLFLIIFLSFAMLAPTYARMIEFSGALDFTYYDWGKDGASNGLSTFDVYEFYLLGNVDVAEDVKAYFETRYEHIDENVGIRQAYIDWILSNAVTLRTGYFYMPLGSYQKVYYSSVSKKIRNLCLSDEID